jgi:hypothetical protein
MAPPLFIAICDCGGDKITASFVVPLTTRERERIIHTSIYRIVTIYMLVSIYITCKLCVCTYSSLSDDRNLRVIHWKTGLYSTECQFVCPILSSSFLSRLDKKKNIYMLVEQTSCVTGVSPFFCHSSSTRETMRGDRGRASSHDPYRYII